MWGTILIMFVLLVMSGRQFDGSSTTSSSIDKVRSIGDNIFFGIDGFSAQTATSLTVCWYRTSQIHHLGSGFDIYFPIIHPV